MRALLIVLVLGACGDDGGTGTAGDARDDHDAPPSGPANLVFLTSTTTTPVTLGGVAQGDAMCAERAQAAGLAGTYRAWLSSTMVDAKNSLGTARGWRRIDGKPFADTLDDLIAGRVFYPLRIDELGQEIRGARVLTATGELGTRDTLNRGTCGDFTMPSTTSVVGGSSDGTTLRFTNRGGYGCASTVSMHLYCFGTDAVGAVGVERAQGRRAFVASGFVPVANGGVASVDAYCQAAADAAQLPGTFLALVATTTASAASRFDLAGEPWVRVDGARIAATPADFMSGNHETTVTQQADGTYVWNFVWTGAEGTATVAIGSENCVDWTNATTGFARFADPGLASADFFKGPNGMRCNGADGGALVYCLQQ